MNQSDEIPSDEEYLAMKDWAFSPRIDEGQSENFHWLRIDGYYTPFETLITVPPSYRIVMIHFDGWGGGALCFGNTPGWRTLGKYAISDVRTGIPTVQGNADMAWAIVDADCRDEDLLPSQEFFTDADENNPKFWNFLNIINPHFYFEWGNAAFFAAKDKSTLDPLQSPELLKKEEEEQRLKEFEGRKGFLTVVETDCEPEKCREPDCNRRRMKLAVLCHWHQRKKFR